MNIVLITTGQPSTNPRIVKEADALMEAGHTVTLLYSYYIGWAYEADIEILQKAKWKYQLIGGSPYTNKWLFSLTKIQFKVATFLNKYVGNNLLLAEKTQARSFNKYLNAAKKINADWYIGHNLGALAIAVKAAKYHNAKSGFDFEDYHRGEVFTENEINRIIYLENEYVPYLNYISTASPLITEKIKLNFSTVAIPLFTIYNVFPKKNQPEFTKNREGDNGLKLFWFSQTVGTGRGLEKILEALKILNDDTIVLTVVGAYTESIKANFFKIAGAVCKNIHFLGTVAPDQIPVIAATMDVGLALEQSIPYNRDICLTNKIFIYLQAGNAVLLTNTNAQTQFDEEYKVGQLCETNDVVKICSIIKLYKANVDLLNQQKEKNWQLANNLLNWENESKKLLSIIEKEV